MKIMTAYSDGSLTVKLSGELDHHSAKQTMCDIDEAIDSALPRDLVLDMSELGFMDSSGIAVILRANRKIKICGGRLSIENPRTQPLRVLDASGIDRLVTVRAKREVTT